MIRFLYTHYQQPLAAEEFQACLQVVSKESRKSILRYSRWEDRYNCLFGRILILIGLKSFGYKLSSLPPLKYTPYLRPYLDFNIDFNVSHSGNAVICAFSDEGKIGIDIEQVRELEVESLFSFFHPDERVRLRLAKNPLLLFYELWTRKESIIKADGQGLNIPLYRIRIDPDGKAEVEGKVWQSYPIEIFDDYCIHVATTNAPPTSIIPEYIEMVNIVAQLQEGLHNY